MNPTPAAAYVHIPFCAHRCGYCNFTVVAGRDDLQARYLHALELELRRTPGGPHPVRTLFVGGGTPTRLGPAGLTRLFEILHEFHPLAAGGEFSVEANPVDLTPPVLDVLAAGGVTRLSLGGQSFDPRALAVLERDHDPETVRTVVREAAARGFDVSLDLIFAVPGSTAADWERELAAALALPLAHLSTYGLTFEKGTAFWNRRARGMLTEVDEESQGKMFETAIDVLTAAGFEHYETSNFARPGKRCRHNETYWAGDEYFAVGAGASRYVAGRRETNHRSTTTYLRRIFAGDDPTAETETLSPEDRAREAFVIGLRRRDGIRLPAFRTRFGFDPDVLFAEALTQLAAWGFLERDGDFLRLTRAGLLVSDAIWPHLLRC